MTEDREKQDAARRRLRRGMAAVTGATVAGEGFGITAAHAARPGAIVDPVVTNNDDEGAGSLRAAIEAATPGSTITFAPEVTGTIDVGDHIELVRDVTIQGPGADVLTLDGGGE